MRRKGAALGLSKKSFSEKAMSLGRRPFRISHLNRTCSSVWISSSQEHNLWICSMFSERPVWIFRKWEPLLYFVIIKYLDKTEKIDSRTILSNFMIHKNLYESISDVMQCIVTCFFFGHNESYVESIGSVLKHHYPTNRNVTLAHLEDEVVVAWNGPPIPHADRLIKASIDRI